MSTKEVGNFGENLACEYLVKKGYKIIGRNYRINFGEIDIIARKNCGLLDFLQGKRDKTIHFVEVKTSQGFHPKLAEGFSPEQRADYKKQNKYRRLAEIWLSKNKISENIPYQIDIIAVSFNRAASSLKATTVIFNEIDKPEINYFENVISA